MMLLVVVVVLVSGGSRPSSAGFLIAPSPMNATVNSAVNFTCQADSPATYGWFVNGRPLNYLSPPLGISFSADSNGVQIMTVFCDESRHMSIVVCRAVLFADDTIIRSSEAVLRIQGRLGEVTAPVVDSSNAENITISWTPPFSLDITGVDPDFTHTVRVYSNITGLLLNNATNIAGSSFTYSPENPDPSVLLEFFIVAVDPLGQEGEPCIPVQGFFLGDPIPIPAEDVEVEFILRPFAIFISFTANVLTTAYGRRPTSYVVFALSTDDSSPDCVCDTEAVTRTSEIATLMFGDCGGCLLRLDIVYRLHIIIQTVNEVGRSNSTGAIILVFVSPDIATSTVEADGVTTGSVSEPAATGSEPTTIIASTIATFVVGVLLGSIITIIIVMIINCLRKHAQQSTALKTESGEIEMKSCDAYNVVAKKQNPVNNQPPPMYEEINL